MRSHRALSLETPLAISDTWSLADIFASDAVWQSEISSLFSRACHEWFSAEQLKLLSPLALCRTLEGLLLEREEIENRLERVRAYAFLRWSEDCTTESWRHSLAELDELCCSLEPFPAFLEGAVGGLEDEVLRKALLLTHSPQLHVALETVLEKRAGLSVNCNADDSPTVACDDAGLDPEARARELEATLLRANFKHPETGTHHEVDKESLRGFLYSRDRALREGAYLSFYEKTAQHHEALAAMLSASLALHFEQSLAHGFQSCAGHVLAEEGLRAEDYDRFLCAIEVHLPRLHEYVARRSKALGITRFTPYDRLAPCTAPAPAERRPILLEDAARLITASLKPLGPQYMAWVRHAFWEERWVHARPAPAKLKAQFTHLVYGCRPKVLLTWRGNAESLFALTHELGHAMHGFIAQQQQPLALAYPGPAVGEIFSNLHETLLARYAQRGLHDTALAEDILDFWSTRLEDNLFRQALFARFEQELHTCVERKSPLPLAALDKKYLEMQARWYGPLATFPPCAASAWVTISHFHRPLYVFYYPVGAAIALALADDLEHCPTTTRARIAQTMGAGRSKTFSELATLLLNGRSFAETAACAVHAFEHYLPL